MGECAMRLGQCFDGASLRGQAGVELTAVLGIFLIIILFYSVAASGMLSHFNVQGNYNDAYRSVQSLASAADLVFVQGDGASSSVQIVLPPSTDFNTSKTFIGKPPSSPSLTQNTINIHVSGTDLFAITRAPLIGHFPEASGEHVVYVVSHGTYVSISPYLLDVEPSSIHVKVPRAGQAGFAVFARVVSPEGARVNVTSSWPHPHVSLNATPAYFLSQGESTSSITIVASADAEAAGVYYSQLNLTAYDISSGEERGSISLPLVVEVTG